MPKHNRNGEAEGRRPARQGRYPGREEDANFGYANDPYLYGAPGHDNVPFTDEDYYAQRNFGRRYGPAGLGMIPYGFGGPVPHPGRQRGYVPEGARRAPEPHERDFFDKAGDEVQSWFGDEDAQARRHADAHEGEHRGKGPKGYQRSDERIREDVHDRLADDSWLDASDIEVSVENGEVTLNGHIPARPDKRRAEDISESVSAVKHVQNNLRVGTPVEKPAPSAGAVRSFG